MATEHARDSLWKGDLLPHIVDRLARKRPDAVFGLWPVAPASYEDGFRTITYAQLANVINGLAWWLIEQIGPGEKSEVLTYVGPNDVRVMAMGLAAIKAGYVVNSPVAVQQHLGRAGSLIRPAALPHVTSQQHRALFESLKCQILVTTSPTPPAALTILETVKPRQLVAPDVDELLGNTYSPYDYHKTYLEARWDPLIIVHSSGSTGIPKPLIWTHEMGARQLNSAGLQPPGGVFSVDRYYQGKRVMAAIPTFHGAGVIHYMLNAIPFGNIMIAPVAVGIATAQGLVDALKQTPADIAILVPSVVAELAQNPELLDFCVAHLEVIFYIGGDLPQAIGDRVAAKMRLRCQWGASEVGLPHHLVPPELKPSDWRYICFHPRSGAVFDEVSDGVYELVIRRDKALADTQPMFSIRGQDQIEKEYRTRDLFERHPTVPDAWCWRARADDIIVFLNGEKTNPISMEQHVVARNPELSGALVVGAQRFQAALLIEPVNATTQLTTAEEAALIERVWPSVDEANRVAPAHARVEKSLILVTRPDRPLVRAGKGTIKRPASLAQYAADIDKLYANAEVVLEDDAPDTPVDPADAKAVGLFIRDSVRAVTGWSNADDTATFFEHGMDSLQALQLTRALRRGLYRPDLALATVYQNPSIAQLTAAILAQSDGPANDDNNMESLLATYRGLIHQIQRPKSLALSRGEEVVDVVLTGSTGTLGTFVLRALLDRPGIGHVFCLNRSRDGGRAVQADRFAAVGLATDSLDDRVTFIHAEGARPLLGLDVTTYEALRARVGLVIHNAWPVNFNLGLPSFRPQLAGLVNLFSLAASAPRAMRVFFISSVGTVGGRPADAGPAPEAVLESLDTPYPNGYSQSKFLSELLCDAAARHLGIPVAIARVGQVAGPVRRPGLWNRAEWLPSLVISSFHLSCLPDSLGPQFSDVDWVPADVLADVVVDLASQSGPEAPISAGAEVFHLRNPNTTAWTALLPAIADAARARLGKALDVVPSSAWLDRLHESMTVAANGTNRDLAVAATSNPAIKLLDFYREGLWACGAASQSMSVERALASPTLRDMPPVGLDWMRKWVDEWMATRS
ncbi:putative NRPS-like enzyme [Xylariaceae sp. FL0662B]|nr:putative NRPS-like enzyme [Xylariaceae sp. FL0662B]